MGYTQKNRVEVFSGVQWSFELELIRHLKMPDLAYLVPSHAAE